MIIYPTYRDVCDAITAVERAGGGRVVVERCGDSRRGEPIMAVTLHPPGSPPPAPEATVFVVAGLHAMEHVGTVTAIALLRRALTPGTVWSRRRLVVIPLANPDGFLAAEAMLARGGRYGHAFVRQNAAGVDLNRNFALNWDDRYYLHRLLGRVFSPGPTPLSEPETRAVDAAVAQARPDYAVSLHAFGEWIYWPWAGRRQRPRDSKRLEALARAMAARQPGKPYRVMQLGRRSRLFLARGAEIDHFYGRYGALSFLIEIGTGPSIRDPSGWLRPYAWFSPSGRRRDRDVAKALAALDCLATAPPVRRVGAGGGRPVSITGAAPTGDGDASSRGRRRPET